MTPKGMYTVQKSRSFGGLHSSRPSQNAAEATVAAAAAAAAEREEPQYHSAGGGGRRTPRLGSLRRKFQLSRKAASTENNHYRPTTAAAEDEEDGGDRLATPSWKKRHKLANLFRWFKKGDAHPASSGGREVLTSSSSLPAEVARAQASPNKSGQRAATTATATSLEDSKESCVLASVPEQPPLPSVGAWAVAGGGMARSASLDSLCSVASAASSFAFVPLERCRRILGSRILLTPQKRIPLGVSCGPDTYRARVMPPGRPLSPPATIDQTLRTKYKLFDSLPSPLRKGSRWKKTPVAGNADVNEVMVLKKFFVLLQTAKK